MKDHVLTEAEMQALLDGRSPEEAVDGLSARLASGDPEAALLAADLRTFVGALTQPPSATELREFGQSREMNLARLKRELRGRRSVSADEGLFERFGQELRKVGDVLSGRRVQQLGLAVAVAATLVLAVWLPSRDASMDPATIALADGSAYQVTTLAYSAPPSLRGAADDAEAWARAGSAYEAGKYQRAATLFESIAEGDSLSVDARLYAGISWLAAGRPASARGLLAEADRLAAERDLPRGATAHYLGLAALSAGDTTTAREALSDSVEAGGRFADLSRELLDRI